MMLLVQVQVPLPPPHLLILRGCPPSQLPLNSQCAVGGVSLYEEDSRIKFEVLFAHVGIRTGSQGGNRVGMEENSPIGRIMRCDVG